MSRTRRGRGARFGTTRARILTISILGALALVLAACANESGDSVEGLPPLRIVNQQNLFSLSSVVADDQGMFDDHGVEVQHLFNPSGAERAALVIGGEADASILGIVSGFRGLVTDDWHFVGTQVQAGNANALACVPDLGVESLADVEGLTIAAADGSSSYETFARVMAPEYGLTPDDWSLVNLDVSERLAAVVGGSADCMLQQEPILSIAESDGHVRIVPDGGVMGEFDLNHLVLYVSTSFLDSPGGEEATERFLAALVDAGEFIEDDPEAAGAIYAQRMEQEGVPIDDPDLLPVAIQKQGYEVCIGDDFRENLDRWAEIAIDTGDLTEADVPDWDESVRWDLNHRATGGC